MRLGTPSPFGGAAVVIVEHTPVLLSEVLDGLQVRPGARFIDATAGLGGHSRAILAASAPDGRLLCLDADAEALNKAQQHLREFGPRVLFVNRNFAELEAVAVEYGFNRVSGIIFDLGVSSLQLDSAGRGFSFQKEGPLDMRFSSTGPSAADLVNGLPEDDLADLIWRFGEERASRRIARAIIAHRPIQSSVELAELIAQVVGHREKINPATRTFQALRIAVNNELDSLQSALPQAVRLLAPGGRLVVITFHSLEDRIVKDFLRTESQDCVCPPQVPACTCEHRASLHTLTRRPIRPSEEERTTNRRSRSAKLRVASRL